MELKELLEKEETVNVTVTLNELFEFMKIISGDAALSTIRKKVRREFWTRKEALGILGINSSTLWKWERSGYIDSYPFGNRKRYLKKDIDAIMKGKKSV